MYLGIVCILVIINHCINTFRKTYSHNYFQLMLCINDRQVMASVNVAHVNTRSLERNSVNKGSELTCY